MSEKKKYTPTKESLTKFDKVIFLIELDGMSLRTACKAVNIDRQTFHNIINNDTDRFDRYARAREEREDFLLDEMYKIAYDQSEDVLRVKEVKNADGTKMHLKEMNNEFVQRSKLKVDLIKWHLSKMNPKKFGDKLEIDQNTEQRIVIEMDLGEEPKKND
mgnify:FL=1